ncbi:MAG: anaerobic ribonucleoside-triphosphate reductase activating protein [Clostridia bacterium]|nr:anaerobic ribonucleoside-triphosphate reductase activating protein [Clostridia bacterium]
MDINGIQKLTLLDFPGRTACTVFLSGCDLRCPFCHNSELWGAAPAVMDDAELISFLEKRRGLLEGVAFTGGEALLRPELPELMNQIKALDFAVKLDTNGTHPERLEALIEAGLLDYAAMDVKNDLERYPLTCGKEDMDTEAIERSVGILLRGRVPYEFRTTVVKPFHDEASFTGIARMIEGAENYFLQPFADRDTVLYKGFEAPTKEEMERYLEIVKPHVKHAQIRGM